MAVAAAPRPKIVQRTKCSRMTRICAGRGYAPIMAANTASGMADGSMADGGMGRAALAMVVAATAALGTAFISWPAAAQPADDFYKGKQIRIVVGSTAG